MKRRTKASDPPVDGMVTRVAGFGKAVTAKGRRGSGERKQQGVTQNAWRLLAPQQEQTAQPLPQAQMVEPHRAKSEQREWLRKQIKETGAGAQRRRGTPQAPQATVREESQQGRDHIVTSPTWHLGQKGVDVNAAHGTHAHPTITDIKYKNVSLGGAGERQRLAQAPKVRARGMCAVHACTPQKNLPDTPARKGHPPLQGPWGGCARGWGCSW
jgi:hypothetical protein